MPKLEVEYGLRRIEEVSTLPLQLNSSKKMNEKWLSKEIERDKQRTAKSYTYFLKPGLRSTHSARCLTEAFFKK